MNAIKIFEHRQKESQKIDVARRCWLLRQDKVDKLRDGLKEMKKVCLRARSDAAFEKAGTLQELELYLDALENSVGGKQPHYVVALVLCREPYLMTIEFKTRQDLVVRVFVDCSKNSLLDFLDSWFVVKPLSVVVTSAVLFSITIEEHPASSANLNDAIVAFVRSVHFFHL